ncbi:sacsin-like isoform X3 [Anguilla anguilla]|uniref:sacsin-like isoform X2 n=1 Tax=Anguilla anguilla TaxID=7936 RepID=UPI0015B3027C|nr:sacsin-like isoform X2 [Anguilla anguilla]XP_035250648.1 sacsin-like isoform X3 [Anguilla anguilla]
MSFSERQKRRRQNAFGATSPPFIDYLKDILRRYPDGGQILKELIQNADDAGATEVVFIHDDRAYGTQALWAEDLEKYQGPALYAYNNAEFTEDDWRGIQATGRSVKRNDPNKVGRFGIGFNSIYHVTDLPCIFSGKYLGMLDPQEKIFGEREGGMRWSLDDEEDRDTLLVLSDQLQPFRDALVHVSDQTWEDAVSEDKKFNGTLFRFSLRNEPSEISDNLYDSDKMVQLFNSFIADADMSLLFLRNVSSVSLIHISTNGSVNVRHKVSASSPAVNESFHPREMPSVEGFTHFKNVSSYCPSKGKTEVQWLVTMCCMKEGHMPELDSLAGKLSFRPQVDLAFPLDQERSLTDGRLSCFLPLPNNEPNCTGLPVHVNACFGLTDNRRHIKWQEEDQKFDEAAVWNELLVKELLPRAYQMIILDAVRFSRSSDFPSSSAYHLWPDLDQMKHKERWHSVAAGMLRQLLLSNEPVFSLAGDAQKWVTLSEAVFLTDYSMEPQMKNAVSGVLIALGEKLVSIPSHISRDIQAAVENPKTLTRATPAFVRKVFRKNGNAGLSREDKLFILEYVLSDEKYHELWGLQLLPLSNGTFKTFSNEDHNLAFIDNKQFPRELLPGWKDVFLPRDLRSNTLLHLEKLAETSTYNKIINMDSRIVAKFAIKSLPKDWQKTKGHVTWQVGNGQHPPMQWLSDFWKFLKTNWTELSRFVGMPLVPLKPLLDSTSSVILAKLQLNTTLMFQKSRQSSLSDQIAKVVGKVGGTIIKRDTFLDHTDLETYVLTPSPRNILHLFLNLEKHQVIHGIESASAAEKEELKSYLSSLDSLSLAEKGLLSELPFFRSMASLKLNPGEYISVKSKQAVLLNTTPPFPENLLMTDVVAQCANEADRRLLTLLNIDVINAAQAATLLVKGIEKRLYKSQEVDKIMTWILQNGRILFSQDRTLHTKCQDLSFIEIQPSDHKKTSSFFDPGNKTFSTRILNPEFVGIEQCGQTEPITLRIKNILKEYDEENDLFKELIQNAEDAGATTCKFMLDFRSHKDPPDTLIDQDMSLCHGPCLWAYNDELFTEEDWANIVKVGSASKETKVEKIGKFGLGFNSVYHVTDIPSVLSGKNLLILDPNVTHLKKHIQSKASPGIKLNLFQERLFHRFPGQFKPYQGIFDCDLSRDSTHKFFNGTLIKLPFRTHEEALSSEVSKKVFEGKTIAAFSQHLTHNSEAILLFLRNISKVSLEILPENSWTPPCAEQVNSLFKVSRKVVCTIPVPDDTPLKTMQDDSIKVLLKIDAKFEQVIDCLSANIIEVTKKYQDVSDVSYWLVHSCFGMQTSLNMFQKENKQKFPLPVGSIAVPLKKEPQGGNWLAEKHDSAGQVFCFLPLSIYSGLPVHINGFFAVTSNRKGLWDTGVKHEWNKALLQDAVTGSYIFTLSVLKEMSKRGELQGYHYYMFWPDKEKVSTSFQSLTVAFYSAIAHNVSGKAVELFSDGKTWCSIEKARFLHPKIAQNKDVGQIAMKEFLANQRKPYLAVPLPEWVRNSFSQTDLNRIISARTLDWVEFYKEIVFNNLSSMDPKSRNALVLHAIDMNDKAVDNLLKSHPCIPAIGCEQLQFIRSLVNPSGKVACLYDPEEGRFLKGTSEDFCCPKRIQRLTELGMLTNSLSLEDIKERAETITRIWQKNQKEAYKRIQQILDLTREHLSDETSPHWNSLRNIAFIPACPPKITGHDKNTCTALKKPVEVYSFSCQYLVNMMQTTVDQAVLGTHYDSVLRKLGVLENPPLLMVLQQLEHAHLHFRALDGDMRNTIAFECYGYLDEMTKEQTQSEAIFESAKSFPFVLIEGKFVNVKSVAKKVEFEAKPYLYCLPNHFSKFKNLWQCVGMQKHFTSEQLVGVIQELSIEYQSRELSHCDLDLCLRITKRLYEAKDHEQKGCLLPDENGVLRLSHKLFYNDSPWMPVSENAILCHNLVPRSIALHFGVQTTRHHTLQNHLVAGFSPFVKEFGQHEELTVRIKNIIQAYPSKKDILKELIQNADDAQATEIHFVWDKRKHSTMKTFGEKWGPLQGPALCVYNNKVFSDADLEGIQRLGEGGKNEVQGKTGKYGLGFNSVYHLTDCPSILTGDQWLCISDPNLKYVEGGTKLSPGCMYSLGKEFRDSFPDVYNTFLPSNFKLEEGTMFRLPLRTEEMAKMSEISKNTVNSWDIEELSTVLTEDPEGLILFLRHIRKIQFHEICTGDSQMTTRISAEIKLSKNCDVKKTHFQNHVQKSLDAGGPIESLRTIYNISILSSIKKKSEWIVAEQFGSLNENTDLEVEQSIRRVPQAAVAACLTSITEGHPFTGRVFCSLPLPCSTGLPVHVNGNFEVDSSRRDLWKEDGKSKKTEWNESLKLDIIAPLYADLLHYICASGKKSRFSSLKYLGLYLDSSFLWFFPEVTNRVGQEWHGTVDAVFKSINERDFPVIPILSTSTQNYKKQYTATWSSVTKGEPTDAPHFTINEHSESFLQTLEDIGMNVVPFSYHMTHIFTSFERAQVNVGTVSPFTVRKFLKTKPLNDPATTKFFLPLPINQTLIKDKHRCKTLLNYCMEDICKENCNTVCGLPLLLTEDQMLRYFHTDSPRLLTKFCKLFQGHEEDFADYGINGKHIDALQQGNFLKAMTIPASEMYLKPKLEDLLQNCKFDPEFKLHVPEETTRKWLKQLWRFFNDQIKSPVVKDKTNQAFLDIKELFFDSPVVPVICSSQNNKHFLKTMKTLSSVVSFSNPDVQKILCKLGFMTLDLTFFHDFKLSQHFDPELLDTSNRSAVLDQLSLWQHFQFEQIANEDLDELLHFLQSGLGSGQNTQDNKRKLMSLPLFETVQGRRQRIDGPGSVFILGTHLRQNFPELYSIDKVTIFLKNSAVNLSLSEKMNITVLNDLDYYVKFILPSVHKLSDTLVLNSVQMLLKIKHYPKFEDYYENIIFTMKSVKFIRDVFGNLQMASYFYDENEPLHQAMLPKERFVPEKFWDTIGRGQEKPVKELLRELGLKYVVSDDEMIEFANTIESDTKGNMSLERLKHKSECLFASLLKRDVSQKLLKTISTIKFVVPLQIQLDLCKYYKPFAGEREFVAIKGSLIEKDPLHQRLIWTTVPILPSKNCSLQRQIDILKEAGALEQPEPQHVIDNLRNICQGSTKENIQTRAEVFRQSYGFLQAVDFSAQPLIDLPVVLVENDTELVKPKQTVVVLRDSIDFRPYLFRLPTELVRYEEFFKKIGVRDTASTQQYSTVLQEIYRDCIDKQEMNPNQIKTCRRAVQQLFLLIEENANEKTLEIPQPLYLPATDGRLYESSSLYFNDTYFWLSRFEKSIEKKLKLLEKLKKCYLWREFYGDQKLVQLLPHNVRPKMLSEVTTKTLVESSMEPCVYGECCEFSGLFENQLSSSYFMHGLVCILRERSEALPQSDIDAMFLNFNKIKFICCERLETMILLHHEPLDNSTAETQLYVKREQEGCTFYIKHSDHMSNSIVKFKIVKGLAEQINELLKKALRTDSLSVFEYLLMCENMEDVQEVLETNNIRNIAHTDYGQCRLPDPGTPIPEEWIDSLDMNFLNNFEVEEYVGFKNPLSEEYVFAVVAERVKMPLSQGGLCSQKYKIKIGEREIIEVSSLDLYQFKRGKRSSSTVGSCRVLVPSRGSGESEPPPVLPQSMEEIQSEIDKCLEEIWTLSEEERRKGIRRLYLRWHPDKNPDCLDLATEACKYLQKKIEELERGGMTGHRNCGPKQGSSQWSSAFRDFYQEWDQEASRHRRGRERFNQRHSSRQYDFWSFHEGSSGPRPNPNPEEAHRWHRQAKCDLAAARNDTGGTSTEWCLYKVHQAVEKALIGAEYKNTGHRPKNSTSLASLAQNLSHVSPKLNTLPSMVHKLNQLGVDAKKTQYPNYHTSPGIPNDQFNSQNLAQVLDLSSEILTKIYSYIHE